MKTEHFRRRILFCTSSSSSLLLCIILISFYGLRSTLAAPAILGNENGNSSSHLDQQLDQTEAQPDLASQTQQPKEEQAPVSNSSSSSEVPPASSSSAAPQRRISAIQMIKDSLARQDVGDLLGDNVGNILTGILGGGLTNIFQGSSSFIGDADVKQEVDFVLNNVAPPFETILKYGFSGLKNYFGVGQTTVKTVAVSQAPEQQVFLQPVVHANGTMEYIPIYVTVTKPPLLVRVTNPPAVTTGSSLFGLFGLGDGDLEDSDNDIKATKL